MLSLSSIVAVTGEGVVTEFGRAPTRCSFAHCSPTNLVRAKKDTKTLSVAAAFALAGFEYLAGEREDWRKGLFLSAPAPAAADKGGYDKVLSGDDPNAVVMLGSGLDQVRPVSGLIGLPNGLMCFAARITGAYGPNSVAVNEAVGAHQALATALRHHRNHTVDGAVVAGFSQPNERTNQMLYAALDLMSPAGSSDQNATLDLTDSAVVAEFKPGQGDVEIIDAFLFQSPALVAHRLKEASLSEGEVAVVFSSQLGTVRSSELHRWSLERFSQAVFLQTGSSWGYQAEAAGLVEFGILAEMSRHQAIDQDLFLRGGANQLLGLGSLPFLIFSESAFGQRSCVIGRVRL